MELLGWVLIGLLAGALAKSVASGHMRGGSVAVMLLATAGALFAAYLGRLAGFYAPGQPESLLAALCGALFMVALYRLLSRRL